MNLETIKKSLNGWHHKDSKDNGIISATHDRSIIAEIVLFIN